MCQNEKRIAYFRITTTHLSRARAGRMQRSLDARGTYKTTDYAPRKLLGPPPADDPPGASSVSRRPRAWLLRQKNINASFVPPVRFYSANAIGVNISWFRTVQHCDHERAAL